VVGEAVIDRECDGPGKGVTEVDLGFAGRRLDQIFEARARSCPDRTAVVSEGETATYADIDYRADVLAGHLSDLGAAPNVLVALYVERGIDLIVGILGILKAGGGYLPIDASTPPLRVDWLLRDSGAGIAVTTSSLAERVTERSVVLVLADSDVAEREQRRGGGNPAPATERRPTDLAYVIYTSGSTGTPKGVLVLDLATNLAAGRELVYHAVWRYQSDDLGSVRECSMAKLCATELAARMADTSLQLHGAHGYLDDTEVARAFRDSRAATIAAGPSEVMRDIIARLEIDEATNSPS
jgi:acyl-CoA synthetase (AMP-forming)/AMP-acid ligase II